MKTHMGSVKCIDCINSIQVEEGAPVNNKRVASNDSGGGTQQEWVLS